MPDVPPSAPPGQSPAALPELLSAADVARRFGRCERSIRRWCRAGRLVPVRIGRSLFFRSDDIRALLASRINNGMVLCADRPAMPPSGQDTGLQSASNDSLSRALDIANA